MLVRVSERAVPTNAPSSFRKHEKGPGLSDRAPSQPFKPTAEMLTG